ncbi:MAG: NAD(P)-dependent oxidoreductase [Rhodospirillales bacterium]|nr:NAD(P)-dependent oxidoreductase [Rhodospirillales bacterium]
MSKRIAFIGLGQMGGPIAGHLARAGFEITAHDRIQWKQEAWAETYGARVASSCAEAAEGAGVVATSVVTEDDLRDATVAVNGAFRTMAEGGVLVDHSTMSAGLAHELSARARERGLFLLDAPVAGAVEGARKGELSVMVGGEAEAFAKAETFMCAYSREIHHIGPSGHGQLTKMLNQIIIAGVIQGLAEGMTFAHHSGLDADKAVEVLSGGSARSWWLDIRSGQMLDNLKHGRDVNHGRAGLLIKDLAICLADARRHDIGLPMTGLISQLPVETGD